MDLFEITYAAALVAGLLSFASPCVLPLVPAYLCFLGGMSFDQLKGGEDGRTTRLVWPAVAFVLGFSAVFVDMVASETAVNRLLFAHLDWLSMAAGLVIVVLGLHYVGVFRIAFLDFERRFHMERRPAGLVHHLVPPGGHTQGGRGGHGFASRRAQSGPGRAHSNRPPFRVADTGRSVESLTRRSH
jgi:cytochrome c-type biogenesis protein